MSLPRWLVPTPAAGSSSSSLRSESLTDVPYLDPAVHMCTLPKQQAGAGAISTRPSLGLRGQLHPAHLLPPTAPPKPMPASGEPTGCVEAPFQDQDWHPGQSQLQAGLSHKERTARKKVEFPAQGMTQQHGSHGARGIRQ